MKKISILFLLLSVFFSLNAQERPTTVQGIPYDFRGYPQREAVKTKQTKSLKSNAVDFDFKSIDFWVGEGENQAAMVLEFHDGRTPDAIVWGYRWNGEACGHDMIMAIAQADSRILFLTQQTGPMGYTICGIGYSDTVIDDLTYDLEGASTDPKVNFKFDVPNTFMGQTHVPEDPAKDAANAIAKGMETGVIDHPFTQTVYGYACYDYDHWVCPPASSSRWFSGWYKGYWSYFVKDDVDDDFIYSGAGATSRQLVDGSWDAWSWNGDMQTGAGTDPSDHDQFVAASIEVVDVILNITATELRMNESVQLKATLLPGKAVNKDVTWSSTDASVATVDNEGLVKAINTGEAIIKVTTVNGGKTAICKVTVVKTDVSGVKISDPYLNIKTGEVFQLSATVSPDNATNKEVLWSSTNESIASVSGTGVVTAIAAGVTTVTVTTKDGGYRAECEVTVKEDGSVGIDRVDRANILVYPTITTGAIYITQLQNEKTVQIFDFAGRLLLSEKLKVGDNTLDISTYSKGVYLVKIGDKIIKVIKQ